MRKIIVLVLSFSCINAYSQRGFESAPRSFEFLKQFASELYKPECGTAVFVPSSVCGSFCGKDLYRFLNKGVKKNPNIVFVLNETLKELYNFVPENRKVFLPQKLFEDKGLMTYAAFVVCWKNDAVSDSFLFFENPPKKLLQSNLCP